MAFRVWEPSKRDLRSRVSIVSFEWLDVLSWVKALVESVTRGKARADRADSLLAAILNDNEQVLIKEEAKKNESIEN